jgi:uncharacterized protein YndB with AHSA1/START domain
MTTKTAESSFVYVTFIRTTPERAWSALTDPDFMKEYWFGAHFKTDWKQGASWKMVHSDGRITDGGEILEFDPPRRMVLKWQHELRPELKAEGFSRCSLELEPVSDAVKLTVTHTIEHEDSKVIHAVSGGWPRILSNLKSLLETGQVVLSVKPSC